MATPHTGIDANLTRCGFRRLPPIRPLPSASDVEAAGRAAGTALAADYAAFCASHGTGAFDRVVMLPLPADCALGPQMRIEILFGVGGGDSDRDALALAAGTYEDRLPVGTVPVGTDPGGDLLLLGCGPLAGVFVWDHEHRELAAGEFDRRVGELRSRGFPVEDYDIDQLMWLWDETFPDRVRNPNGYSNLYRVADSFTELCAALTTTLEP
jgi:hypothetical protein